MMRIKVAGLMKSSVGTVNTYQIDDTIGLDGDGSCLLQGEASLVRTQKGVLVIASFPVRVPLVCSRCLSQFEAPVALDMKEEFLPTSATHTPLAPGEEAFTITGGLEVDLGEAMRQYVVLALPLKPLCRPNCAGLCPRCGSNLNLGPCGCSPSQSRN